MTLLEPLVNGFLKCMLDPSKKVQEAACSAVATLEEEAGSVLAPFGKLCMYVRLCVFMFCYIHAYIHWKRRLGAYLRLLVSHTCMCVCVCSCYVISMSSALALSLYQACKLLIY